MAKQNEAADSAAAQATTLTVIEILGQAVFDAIKSTGKYRAEEQKAAMASAAKQLAPADLVDGLSRLGNISADRQEMEKSGILVSSTHTPNALAAQVKAAAKRAGVALPITAS